MCLVDASADASVDGAATAPHPVSQRRTPFRSEEPMADVRTAPRTDRKSQIEALLKGAIDLHCHSGPSVMPRRIDHIDAIEDARAHGIRAILFKDHYYSATLI